jgi:hypothetical protein
MGLGKSEITLHSQDTGRMREKDALGFPGVKMNMHRIKAALSLGLLS